MSTLQAVQQVQQQLFALSTQITQLRRDVDKLGTAQDTIKLRQKIADVNQKATDAAKDVGQKLNSLHAEHKTQQTGRLVSTFEVSMESPCVHMYASGFGTGAQYIIHSANGSHWSIPPVILSCNSRRYTMAQQHTCCVSKAGVPLLQHWMKLLSTAGHFERSANDSQDCKNKRGC